MPEAGEQRLGRNPLGLRGLGLRELALLFATGAFCLGGAELALRGVATTRDAFYVWPPGFEYVFRPADGVMPGISGESHFRINESGIRGDPFDGSPRYRILAVGGSTTESLYLDDDEAWPHLLQADLNQRLGGPVVWVGNVGRSGLSSRHHVFQVRELLPQYPRIDVVLLLVGINDLNRRLSKDVDFRTLPQEPPDAIDKLFREAFEVLPATANALPGWVPSELISRLGLLRDRLHALSDPVTAGGDGTVQDEAGSRYITWRRHRRKAGAMRERLPDLEPALEEYRHNLDAIAAFASRSGARVVFATQPTMWDEHLDDEFESLLWMGGVGRFQAEPGHDYYTVQALAEGMERYNTALLDTCRERGIECIDLAAIVPADTRSFYDDCHFNESGARRVAAAVADYLWRSSDFHSSRLASVGSSTRRRGR